MNKKLDEAEAVRFRRMSSSQLAQESHKNLTALFRKSFRILKQIENTEDINKIDDLRHKLYRTLVIELSPALTNVHRFLRFEAQETIEKKLVNLIGPSKSETPYGQEFIFGLKIEDKNQTRQPALMSDLGEI